MGASADRATVYVLSLPNGKSVLTPIAAATNKAGRSIKIGAGIYDLAITPNGKTLYVSTLNDTVVPFDTATGQAGKPIKVSSTPGAYAFSRDGKTAYVANAFSNAVTPIDVATNTAGPAIRIPQWTIAMVIKS